MSETMGMALGPTTSGSSVKPGPRSMGKRAHVATLSVGVTTSTQLDLDDDREDGLAVDEEHDEVRAILRGHDIGEVGGLDWSRRPYAMLVHDPRDSLSASAVPRSAKVTHPPAGV